MMPSRQRRLFAAVTLALLAGSFAANRAGAADDDKHWEEGAVSLPAFPQDADLREFYVSATTTNRFFIDSRTLAVGSDGVVRYTLVVLTAGGATNVSHEGIRCGAAEYKHYATGRGDHHWSEMRSGPWRPIENKPINRHHAALYRDYFCPSGVAIATADEGRNALALGKHPSAP